MNNMQEKTSDELVSIIMLFHNQIQYMDRNLSTMRTPGGWIGRLLRTDKLKWRYEVYRTEEDLGPVTSFMYTIRSGWYGIVKWMKYVRQ